MTKQIKTGKRSLFEKFARTATKASGSSWAFFTAFAVILLWLFSGPFLNFNDTWQLTINTGTTIITFLMVFLIQKSQNRDAITFQLKLNELIISQEGASNRLLDIDDLNEEELQTLMHFYALLSRKAKKSGGITESHSIEEAEAWHKEKLGRQQSTKKIAIKPKAATQAKPANTNHSKAKNLKPQAHTKPSRTPNNGK